MPPFLSFLLKRLVSIPLTLLVVTAILYGIVMLAPPEARASLYWPQGMRGDLSPERQQKLMDEIIERYRLRDPYWVQYGLWAAGLLRGDWGYSPNLDEPVLRALVRRTPITAELTLYSLLVFLPLGILSGMLAGRRPNGKGDTFFRLAAFVATSIPPFVLALMLLSVFYVGLKWFPPERIGISLGQDLRDPAFRTFTGLLTIDGLLNGRPDISQDALRHLVLPVVTLSVVHWATLGRITRASLLQEMTKEYIVAVRSRGIPPRRLLWRHAFRNILTPVLTSTALSAASLVTGVFVVEAIYQFRGVSELIVGAFQGTPDAPATMGFAVYSVIVVLLLMLALDLLQAALDPRARKGMMGL